MNDEATMRETLQTANKMLIESTRIMEAQAKRVEELEKTVENQKNLINKYRIQMINTRERLIDFRGYLMEEMAAYDDDSSDSEYDDSEAETSPDTEVKSE